MSLQSRHDRPAYYRTVRQGDRVRSVYQASGPMAVRLAERDAADRHRARADREADRAAGAELAGWCREVERAVRSALEGAGYRRHKRGEWRRRRGSTVDNPITPAGGASPPARPPMSPEGRAVLARFRAGDKAITYDEARRMYDERPNLLETNGHPAFSLLMGLMGQWYGDDKARAEAFVRNVRKVQADLAGPDPSPAELLLAERAALCWAEANMREMAIAVGSKDQTLAVAAYRLKQVESANRRFLAAVRTLAVVRKLGVPGLQVNIDARSVRMGGEGPANPDRAVDAGHGPAPMSGNVGKSGEEI